MQKQSEFYAIALNLPKVSMPQSFDWPSVFRFRWLRAGAYKIRDGRIVTSGNDEPEWYSPDADEFENDTPGLHREFVKLPRHDHEALLAFIQKYGFLGVDGDGPRASTRLGAETVQVSERLDDIWREHGRLAMFAQQSASDPDKDPRNLIFNKYSPAHLSIQLEEEHGRTVLRVVPTTLLSWMWLRFGQEKTKGHEIRKCALPGCGVTREIGHNATERWQYCCPQHKALHRYRINAGIEAPKVPKAAAFLKPAKAIKTTKPTKKASAK